MARWALACIALVLAPAMLIGAPAAGDSVGSVAAFAIAVALILAPAIALCVYADVLGAFRPALLFGSSSEEQHRRGAFRRQHAPDTPGRPCQPRAPSGGPVGLAR